MQLSIIVLNYNTYGLTCKCLESIASSVVDISYEIILVDNASVECPSQLFKDKFPFIHLLSLPVNLGFAGGNNAGLKVATGDVILLLNSDTEILGRAINSTYTYLISHPEVGVVTSKLIYPSGEIQACCQRFPSIRLELLELTRFQKLLGGRKAQIMLGFFFDHKREMEADWVWGTFFMVTRKAVDKFPGHQFPSDYFMYGEDMEWCYLLKRMGYKIMYYPEGVVIHHVSMSSENIPVVKVNIFSDHEFLFLHKYYGLTRARIIFILRAITFLTLVPRDRKFYGLAAVYFTRAIHG